MIGGSGRRGCSAPGCQGEPVRSWQRVATEAESAQHWESMNAAQQALADNRRGTLELQIADLRSMQERLAGEGRLTPGAAKVMSQQIEAKEAALDRQVPPALFSGGVQMLVLGCADHAVGVDEAGWVHESSCLADAACACTAPAVEPEPVEPA